MLSRPDFDTTKSRAGRRVVPLPAAVLDLLRDHAEAQAVQRRTAAQLWVDEGWICSELWEYAMADPRRAPHRCDGALALGVHERTIMSDLGWSTTAMVSRYAHVVAPIHSDVESRLDVLLWSSPTAQ